MVDLASERGHLEQAAAEPDPDGSEAGSLEPYRRAQLPGDDLDGVRTRVGGEVELAHVTFEDGVAHCPTHQVQLVPGGRECLRQSSRGRAFGEVLGRVHGVRRG